MPRRGRVAAGSGQLPAPRRWWTPGRSGAAWSWWTRRPGVSSELHGRGQRCMELLLEREVRGTRDHRPPLLPAQALGRPGGSSPGVASLLRGGHLARSPSLGKARSVLGSPGRARSAAFPETPRRHRGLLRTCLRGQRPHPSARQAGLHLSKAEPQMCPFCRATTQGPGRGEGGGMQLAQRLGWPECPAGAWAPGSPHPDTSTWLCVEWLSPGSGVARVPAAPVGCSPEPPPLRKQAC